MPQHLTVIFDGEVFRPEKPIDLLANARYQVIIEEESQQKNQDEQDNLWDLLESVAGTIETASDWASEHDHYLYGVPKSIDDE